MLAAYALARRRRRRYAVRFPAAATLASVRQPRLRRVLPAALLATAAALLAVAFAKPEATAAVPVEKASVMLVTDESGSMSANDVAPSRLEAARSAAQTFLDRVPDKLLVGFVALLLADQRGGRADARPRAGALRAAGPQRRRRDRHRRRARTPRSTASRRAAARTATRAPAAVILLSDGKRTEGSDPLAAAQRAKQLGIPVSTVALGTSDGTVFGPQGEPIAVPPDPATLQEISRITGGTFTEAADAGQLDGVYKKLGSKIGTKHVKREVSSSFAAAGLLLLLGGLGSGLRWRSRLP